MLWMRAISFSLYGATLAASDSINTTSGSQLNCSCEELVGCWFLTFLRSDSLRYGLAALIIITVTAGSDRKLAWWKAVLFLVVFLVVYAGSCSLTLLDIQAVCNPGLGNLYTLLSLR